jgi:hypothetical protein
MRVLGPAVLLWALLFSPVFSRASAQAVSVRVTAAESGDPIQGVFLSLLDHEGRVLRSSLSNESGLFQFPLISPGTFQIRAEMIGRETRHSPLLFLSADETRTIVLPLSFHAIPLKGIRVEGDGRCQLRPEDASQIYRVWEEARKALRVQEWTEDEKLFQFQITSYERDMDRRARKVRKKLRNDTISTTGNPIRSLPVEELLSAGFVRSLEDGGHQYFGPDAGVLLSDLFLDTHCLRLKRSWRNWGALGLVFEPVGDPGLPDIEGVLWIDEDTAGLRFLEYSYTWAPWEEAEGVAGGRVEFESMPNGAWIVGKWWIRMPIMVRGAEEDSPIWVDGVRESGGEVTHVRVARKEVRRP